MVVGVGGWGAYPILEDPFNKGASPLSTLLWFNPVLQHFSEIPDPIIWAGVRIKRLQDGVEGGRLSPFDRFKASYQLPNWHLFRYLQLKHAFMSQFGSDALELQSSALEFLLHDDSLVKLMSKMYKELFTV